MNHPDLSGRGAQSGEIRKLEVMGSRPPPPLCSQTQMSYLLGTLNQIMAAGSGVPGVQPHRWLI